MDMNTTAKRTGMAQIGDALQLYCVWKKVLLAFKYCYLYLKLCSSQK